MGRGERGSGFFLRAGWFGFESSVGLELCCFLPESRRGGAGAGEVQVWVRVRGGLILLSLESGGGFRRGIRVRVALVMQERQNDQNHPEHP